MTQASRRTGQTGEDLAKRVLSVKGFQIEAVNWRMGTLGEIDLIAYHPRQAILAFVEVKTRRTAQYGTPQETVDPRKQTQLAILAEAYLAAHPQPPHVQMRFDVIGIFYPGQGKPAQITHIEDAFRL